MYKFYIKLAVILGLFLGSFGTASAVALMVPQGGTGSTTLTSILVGNGTSPVQSLIIGSNLTLTGTTLSASLTGSGDPFPFTSAAYGVSTSTIVGFLGGMFSVGSSTIQDLHATTFTLGALSGGLGANAGTVYVAATTTAGTGLSYTNGQFINDGVTSISATAPLVNNLSTGAVSLTCPTCAVFAYPFPAAATTTLLTLSGGVNASGGTATFGVLAGSLDAGGATFFEIPNGTGPTCDDVGEICHDTTDNMLILDDFVVGKANVKIWSITVASTSPAFIAGGLLPVPLQADGYTITAIKCYVLNGTSKVIAVEDAGANSSEDITCATTATSDDGTITNAAYTAEELSSIDFGATTGAVDYVTIAVFGQWTRE